MSLSRAEARLVAQMERRHKGRQGGAKSAGKRSHTVGSSAAAYRGSRSVALQAYRAAARAHNASIPANRLEEHKTFDANNAAGPVTMANVIDNTVTPSLTPFSFGTAGTAWCLNQVPLGNSSITRVGRRFANTALAIRALVQAGSTTKTANCLLLLVWDRNPNTGAAMPTYAQILSGATPTPNSLTNKDNAPRFKILRRWQFQVMGNNTTAGQQTDKTQYYIDEFVKMKNKVTLLTAADTTGVVPDMVEGALHLYVISDQAAGTTAPSLSMQTRLYFSDH